MQYSILGTSRRLFQFTIFLAILVLGGCFSPENSELHLESYTESDTHTLVGFPLSLYRTTTLLANFEYLDAEDATIIFNEICVTFMSDSSNELGLVEEYSQTNRIDYISGDSLAPLLERELSPVNCVHTFNDVEDYLSFELIAGNGIPLWLTFYRHDFNEREYRPFYSIVSDTSLFIHDLYAVVNSNSKAANGPDFYLVEPAYAEGYGPCGIDPIADYFYQRLQTAFAFQFVGDNFLEFMTDEFISLLAEASGAQFEHVVEDISHSNGSSGFEHIVKTYISKVYINGMTLVTVYNYFNTYLEFQEAVAGIFQDMNAYKSCVAIDKAFMDLWCSETLDFPYSVDDATLVGICRSWEESCGIFDNSFIVQTGFGLNNNNRGRLCNECRDTNGYSYDEMPGYSTTLDYDGDGVTNEHDKCPCNWDDHNEDLLGPGGTGPDGYGDACQDFDGDGVMEGGIKPDNCHWAFNPNQEDTDEDNIGDQCDPDMGLGYDDCRTNSDLDIYPDCVDNCDFIFNPGQFDDDNDGVGNACDNCNMWNSNQLFNPCLVPPPRIIDSTCTQEEIDEELEYYYSVMSCISGAGDAHILPSPMVQTWEGQMPDPDNSEPRICILRGIQELGDYPELYCTYYFYSPGLIIIGGSIVEYYSPEYEATCNTGDVDHVNLTDYADEIDHIQHCCKSRYLGGDVNQNLNTLNAILACIPTNIPEPQCVDFKTTLNALRDIYQEALDYWESRAASTDQMINRHCYN